MTSVGFLGPFGTFTEQALRTQPDLIGAELVPYPTVPDALDAVTGGAVDVGFVPLENSIEGMVNFTQDALAFDHDLLIQREVVLDVEHCVLAKAGATIEGIKVLHSIPVATAQCHHYLRTHLPGAEIHEVSSTAEAARLVGGAGGAGEDGEDGDEIDTTSAALSPRVAAELYGLEVLASDVADHEGNQTRFVVVARDGVPAATGHDRTGLVVYQRANEPGSLLSILGEFSARRINLSNLVSRPTKAGGLGDYCFIIYADGHIADELIADAIRDLHAKHGGVKFLGSYPSAASDAPSAREHADARWRQADDWMRALRGSIRRTSSAE